MQLISLPASPFATRVRIAVRAKGLDVEIVPPPSGWPNDRRFRDVSPTGRVPVLILDDGEAVWESAVILELLEELFPQARPLLPADVLERARARQLVRVADLYLMPPMVALAAPQSPSQSPTENRRLLEQLTDALSMLDDLLEDGPYAVGGSLSHADCAIAPALLAARITGSRLGIDPIEALPRVEAYARAMIRDQHVVEALLEMQEGIRRLVPSR
ncbi:glutathione S-transferase family protein [Caulobacter radicis]|uniref:glutathione S-transferase family protein n=1 Tax=Caulobacter radicis TaxID=2172650 RepID=UPI000D5634C8|nr:glutathione S-transferase family protein [Caulobacter radicis]PVM91414.1 glutathione S-transferase family protein [Caulobacter radicis]